MKLLNTLALVAALTVAHVAHGQTQSPQISNQQEARGPDADEARLDAKWVSAILGMKVETPRGARLGTVKNVVVDGYGQPTYAIVAYGGVLGLGTQYTAIPWLTVADLLQSDRLLVDQAQLLKSPVMRGAKPDSAQRGWRHAADAYWRPKVASEAPSKEPN